MFVAHVSIRAGGLGSAYSKRSEPFKITPFFHFQSWWFRIITFRCSWSDLYVSAVLQLQSSNLELSPRGINAPQWLQITSHAVKRAMWLTLLKTPTFGKDLHLNPRHAESQADTKLQDVLFCAFECERYFPSFLLYLSAKCVRVCKIALCLLTSASFSKKSQENWWKSFGINHKHCLCCSMLT